MPVAIRLSKNFYDRFGDDATGELINALNSMDLAYRSELKEVNAHNFALFDAKLDQRFAEQDAKIEKRFADFETKFQARLAEQDILIEKRLAEQDAKFEARFSDIDRQFGLVAVQFGEVRTEIAAVESRLIRWMFVFWTTNFLALAGLALAVFRAQ